MTLKVPLFLSAALLLISCGGHPNSSQQLIILDQNTGARTTDAETPLVQEINRLRVQNGRAELKRSAKLDAVAAQESARLAASGSRSADVSSLRNRSGFSQAGVLVGTLKDSGPSTGSDYPKYWMKQPGERNIMLNLWSTIGVGTSKTASGDLVSTVIFAGIGR